MTQAMTAAARTQSGPKVLRIGVMQGTRITEERIVRNRDTVTVGTTEKNTFTVVAEGFVPRFELFPLVNGQYMLNFSDTMTGRVALAQGPKSLEDLRKSSDARKVGNLWQLTLTEQSRGKVSIGDVSFLFQFVHPPPPQPKPQLPAAIRSGWVKNIDWTYNACLSFFLVMSIAGVAYVEYVYDPIVDDDGTDDPRMVRLLSQPPAPDEPEPTPQQTPDTNAQAAAQPTQQAQARPSPAQTAAAREARQQRQAAAATESANRAAQAALSALNNAAEFAALTSTTDSGHGSARDALANGGLMAGTERDLQNLGGISTSNGGSGLRRTGLAASAGGNLGGRGLGQGGQMVGQGDNIGSGNEIVRERVIRGEASLGSGDSVGGDGEIDANRVASIIRGQLGGIRSCYERALRNNPTLAGRLEVHFTIGTSGRVTAANSSGLPASPEVGTCVTQRIRGLVFPTPDGGAVDFSFPFTFAPGG